MILQWQQYYLHAAHVRSSFTVAHPERWKCFWILHLNSDEFSMFDELWQKCSLQIQKPFLLRDWVFRCSSWEMLRREWSPPGPQKSRGQLHVCPHPGLSIVRVDEIVLLFSNRFVLLCFYFPVNFAVVVVARPSYYFLVSFVLMVVAPSYAHIIYFARSFVVCYRCRDHCCHCNASCYRHRFVGKHSLSWLLVLINNCLFVMVIVVARHRQHFKHMFSASASTFLSVSLSQTTISNQVFHWTF